MDAPTGPACAACGAPAVVHWQRRLNDDEIVTQQAIEQERRNDAALLADPDQPSPLVPPMPDFLDDTTIVHACADHSITIDQAALVHAKDCTAPPACTCTPEPPPKPDPDRAPVELPPGW
jgi:hypothetical protein